MDKIEYYSKYTNKELIDELNILKHKKQIIKFILFKRKNNL